MMTDGTNRLVRPAEASPVEDGGDASLCHGNGLLLHCLVDRYAVRLPHLVGE